MTFIIRSMWPTWDKSTKNIKAMLEYESDMTFLSLEWKQKYSILDLFVCLWKDSVIEFKEKLVMDDYSLTCWWWRRNHILLLLEWREKHEVYIDVSTISTFSSILAWPSFLLNKNGRVFFGGFLLFLSSLLHYNLHAQIFYQDF